MGTNPTGTQPPQTNGAANNPGRTEATLSLATGKSRRWLLVYTFCDLPVAILGLILGLIASGLAGSMATPKGASVRQWFGGWEGLCGFVAVVGFVATALNAVHKLADFTGRRKQTSKCSAELQAIALEHGKLTPDELTGKVSKVLLDHNELLAGVKVPLGAP